MRVPKSTAKVMEAIVEAAALLVSPWAPARIHPGRRACNALAAIPASRVWANERLARSILVAQWRSAWLLKYVRRLNQPDLIAFLDAQVRFEGECRLQSALDAPTPLILATPHSGLSVLGCLAIARRMHGRRRFAVLYQDEARNAGIPALFERAGVTATLLSGVGGVVRALEILRRGGCVATMPDVFNDVADTLAVPFLGRWLRVAAGTAFLARRSGALIVPGYVKAGPEFTVHAEVAQPIDSANCTSDDERQDIFALSCRLFAEFERCLERAPEHWLYWDLLPRVSTPLELPRGACSVDIAIALTSRCRAIPGLLRRVPELAPLICGAPP
jgi:lauroyl/myristoyl acyltransferase